LYGIPLGLEIEPGRTDKYRKDITHQQKIRNFNNTV